MPSAFSVVIYGLQSKSSVPTCCIVAPQERLQTLKAACWPDVGKPFAGICYSLNLILPPEHGWWDKHSQDAHNKPAQKPRSDRSMVFLRPGKFLVQIIRLTSPRRILSIDRHLLNLDSNLQI